MLQPLGLAANSRSARPWLVTSAIGFGAVITGLSSPASALTVQQTFSNTFALNPIPVGTGSRSGPASIQFNVQPFDPALGTLNSATIEWLSSGSASLATGPAVAVGTFSFSFGGSVSVNTSSYSGYGNGGGAGGAPFSTFSANIASTGTKKVFTQAQAGVGYDSLIWAAINGSAPYSVSFSSGSTSPIASMSYNNVLGQANIYTDATITYDYTPFATSVPGPTPLLGAAGAWRWSRRLRRRSISLF